MKPTEILMQEHRVIEQVLDCLEILAQRGEADGSVDWESVEQTIDFFQNFADRCHHHKEENCLFPMLEQKDFSPEQGPTSVMREEHEVGRQHIRGMQEAAANAASESSQAIAGFLSHAQAFVQLLRNHIQKEDHCLFQMADQALTEQEQKQLMESFARVEHDDLGPETHEKYLDLATQLAKHLGVQKIVSDSSTCGNCCSHD